MAKKAHPAQKNVLPFEPQAPTTAIPTPLPSLGDASKPPDEIVTVTFADLENPPSTGPILDLIDEQGQWRPAAAISVSAAMFYPGDEAARNEFLLVMTANDVDKKLRENSDYDTFNSEQLGATFGEQLEPYGGVAALVHARSLDDIQKEVAALCFLGSIAGQILITIAQHAQAGLPASLTKAIGSLVTDNKWLEEMAKQEGWHILSGPRRKRAIRDEWKRFQPVAHLWAADYAFLQMDLRTAAGEQTKSDAFTNVTHLFSSEYSPPLPDFLALAEVFRRIGLTTFPRHGRKEPILDPDETWQLPDGLELPDYPVGFKVPK